MPASSRTLASVFDLGTSRNGTLLPWREFQIRKSVSGLCNPLSGTVRRVCSYGFN